VEPIHRVRLRPGQETTLLAGHAWIYRNQFADIPTAVAPGDLADVHDARGSWLGRAYLNPHSMIVGRLLAREKVPINDVFFLDQLRQAQALRERLLGVHIRDCPRPYRVVHGEADTLPGLIVDRYGDVLVLQLMTAGMDRRRELIVAALDKIFQPRLIVARNDSPMREREGLPRERVMLKGALPAQSVVTVNDLTVAVDLWEGQKTGLYLDQIDNYPTIAGPAKGAKVLDCFSYVGLWGLHAARYGATEVICVDQSVGALERAAMIVKENGYESVCAFHAANVFDDLRDRERQRERYDLIILDPPAFVKSRSRLPEAVRGYKEINLRAMKLLSHGGYLMTCSCSHHLAEEHLEKLLLEAAYDTRRSVRLVARRGQGLDHPMLLAMPETEYLKCLLLQVM
jgi:23S rRNA (cytosine1962-C5)-methyltransferase